MPIAQLTTGCIMDILNGEVVENPILQILGSKRIQSNENSERYRLLVSDGKYMNTYAMLTTQLNPLILDNQLSDYSIIRVDKFITSIVNKADQSGTKRVIIIVELQVLNSGAEVGQKIGDPIAIIEGNGGKKEQSSAMQSNKGFARNEPAGNSYKPNASVSMNNTMSQNISERLTHPISSLSPYQNRWVIKVRVTSKTPIRSWNNAKGEGKLFSMDLMDESGEIRATAFKEQCDKYFDLIQVDKVYFISKCTLKPANKQYSTLKNDYEMTFNNDTIVEECEEVSDSIPNIQYNFVPIAQLANMESNTVVDVIGICREAGDIFQFTAKTSGRELKKREVTIIDTSNAAISLTLWGTEAENFDGFSHPVILLKNARINEFGGGKTLSMGAGSTLKMNPDISDGHKLRGWFDNGGGDNISTSISARSGAGVGMNSEWMDLLDVQLKNLGAGDKPDYFTCKAVINIVKSNNAFYKACKNAECNKKVIDQGNGIFRCEKCNEDSGEFKYRLLLNIYIGDWSSNRWITCFSDLAEVILNRSAQEVGAALENDKESAESILAGIRFKSFIFKLRTKVEHFGDSARNKITAVSATPINYKEYNNVLIKNLQQLTGISKN